MLSVDQYKSLGAKVSGIAEATIFALKLGSITKEEAERHIGKACLEPFNAMTEENLKC